MGRTRFQSTRRSTLELIRALWTPCLLLAAGIVAPTTLVSAAEVVPLSPDEHFRPAKGEPAAEPSAVSREIEKWVEQLGDPSISVRRKALEQLIEARAAAGPAVVAGLRHSDPEVRRQCRWLIPRLRTEEIKRRLAALRADKTGQTDPLLFGWERYRKLVGNDDAARELFALLYQSAGDLMLAVQRDSAAAGKTLDDGLRRFVSRAGLNRDDAAGYLAAVLLLASDPEIELPATSQVNTMLCSVLIQESGRKLVGLPQPGEELQRLQNGRKLPDQSPFAAQLRRLLGIWIRRPCDPKHLQQKLQVGLQLELPETLDLAGEVLEKPADIPSSGLTYAMFVVGRMGGKPHVARFEGLLENTTRIGTSSIRGKRVTTEARDLALAWLVLFSGQDFSRFGMPEAKSEFERLERSATPRSTSTRGIGFADEGDRDKALAMWRDHAARQRPAKAPPLRPWQPHGTVFADAHGNRADGFVALVDWPVAADSQLADDSTVAPQTEIRRVDLRLADRSQVIALSQARTLLTMGETAAAVRLIDRALAEEEPLVYRPGPGSPLMRGLKPEALQLLADLPPAARAAYRLQFEQEARTALTDATERGDWEAASQVAQRYFFTRAGAEATWLVAHEELACGRAMTAAVLLERLQRRHWQAAELEPALTLQLAACWARAGMDQEFADALQRLAARRPDEAAWISGGHGPLAIGRRDVAAFANLVDAPPPASEPGEWPMHGGEPGRNGARKVAAPYVAGQPLFIDEPGRRLAMLQGGAGEGRGAPLPWACPLVVNGTIVARTLEGLMAFDAETLEFRWDARLEGVLRELAAGSAHTQPDEFASRLLGESSDAAILFALASDGQRVFALEESGDVSSVVVQQSSAAAVRRVPREVQPNLLVACNLQSGKLRWEQGGTKRAGGTVLAGARFLSAPLPLGRRLYVTAKIERDTCLLELDAASGDLLRKTVLALEDPDDEATSNATVIVRSGQVVLRSRETHVSPAYSEGVFVCQAGPSQFVAIDLASHTVIWVYQYVDPDLTPRNQMARIIANQGAEAPTEEPRGGWSGTSLLIAQGKVLLAPAESDEIVCLGLHDGALHWTKARRDGVYLGGAYQDGLIVVGRSSVWALRLADGSPLWPHGRACLPRDAVPSGRGLLSTDSYYVPLTTGEIAQVDLKAGRIAARSRAFDGVVPGNLVACRGAMLSQDLQEVRCFAPLATELAMVAKAVEARPGDVGLLEKRGLLLLSAGEVAEAVRWLRRALDLGGRQQTRDYLAEAYLEGLKQDFGIFFTEAQELAERLPHGEQKSLLLGELAAGFHREGKLLEAASIYMRLAENDPRRGEVERVETFREVRRDRWMAARLAEVLAAATGETRSQLDQLIDSHLGKTEDFAWLGCCREISGLRESALRQAARWIERGSHLRAELLLRQLLDIPDRSLQREAAGRLAELFSADGHPQLASAAFRLLRERYAEVADSQGRTGLELYRTQPQAGEIRQAIENPYRWPAVRPQMEESENGRPPAQTSLAIPIASDPDPLSEDLGIWLDAQSGQVTAVDRMGRTRWKLPLSFDQEWSQMSVYQRWPQVWQRGNLVVGWLGNAVFAVDTSTDPPKMLWSEKAERSSGSRRRQVGMPMALRMRMLGMGESFQRSPLVLTSGAVCFVQDENLTAVDAYTGELLWRIEEIPANSRLLGNADMLLLAPPEGDEAAILSAIDGQELGRCPLPAADDWLWISGCEIVVWNSSDDQSELCRILPLENRVLWRKSFAGRPEVLLVDRREVAVFSEGGRFSLVSLASGEESLATQLPGVSKFRRFYVQRSADALVVAVHATDATEGMGMPLVMPFGGLSPLNGPVFGLNPASGELLWQTEVEGLGFGADLPPDLPVLVLYHAGFVRENNRQRLFSRLLCLDRRTGRMLHEAENNRQAAQGVDVVGDPDNNAVDVSTFFARLRFVFEPATVKSNQ
ncbi:MAG: PQQ-binding-like beta-propeller repeat protein [Planctomycetota bacterium]